MATLKYSRQRESIKEFLRTRTDHPTADVVYENMKLIYPNISLGTVYRNLSLLADLGEIKKLSSFAGADHFDGRTERHCHFMCIRCERENFPHLALPVHPSPAGFPVPVSFQKSQETSFFLSLTHPEIFFSSAGV